MCISKSNMDLSLFYFVLILFTLLSITKSTEFNIQCPTSRRLLFFGGSDLPIGEKKSHRSSSSSKSLPSSPPKYARSGDSRGLTIFIEPQTSNELGHKIRSYTHLLKSKLYTNEEKAELKRLRLEKKKELKKKNSSSTTKKTQELVAIDDDNDELNRCKALLHIDSTTAISSSSSNNDKKTKKSKKDKSTKQQLSSKVKNVTRQEVKDIKNKVTVTTTNSPINDKKSKSSKGNSKTNIDEKKTIKINENRPFTSSSPPSSQSTINTKSKRIKPETITIIQQTTIPFNTDEDEIDNKNNSVVGRAIHFVRNMFQLSDDIIDENQAEEDPIIDITNEQQQQQQHHHSRKLLSIDENDATTNLTDESAIHLYLNNEQSIEITDDSSFVLTSISKRQLLSVKTSKHSTLSKPVKIKDKKQKSSAKLDENKPKVGWAYRYRISRYLAAQKMKRTGNKNKQIGGGGGKAKQSLNSKQNQKKTSLSTNTKVSKRKLLEYHSDDDDDDSNSNEVEISNENIVKSVSITENFRPKRQLLISKTKDKSNDNDDKINIRRRKKSFEELTDPIAIVQSYDRGLYKPRVGWQFRYRVSRYIDSLRENIREDQERLKLGLQAIKRKTPQELSGRRKRVLEKSFTSDSDQIKKQEEKIIKEQDNKPNVGWRYRYRISKMAEAKKSEDHTDNEADKNQASVKKKKKSSSHSKSQPNIDEKKLEEEKDLDPELRKINAEGRRVGWAYRYRIRQKLDHLKQQQAESGIPFDLATLSGKREKKVIEPKVKSIEKKTTESVEQKPHDKSKSVGWEYRYRLSKMRDALKRQKTQVSTNKKQDKKPIDEQLDPELSRLTPEERIVGWEYRYRIRRKLDSQKNAASGDNESGKRAKKSASSKRKDKQKIMKTVEESIENILNLDDIDETPFMKYFHQTSSYILSNLLPTAKKTFCLLPLSGILSLCDKGNNYQISPIKEQTKPISIKKLRTKKEQRAKQFIHSHRTKLGAEDKATERRVDEAMKTLYKKPSLPPLQTPPSLSLRSSKNKKTKKKQRIHPPKTVKTKKQKEPIQKVIGISKKKDKNKKRFQIIGQEVKIKQQHLSPPSVVSTPLLIVELPKTMTPPRLRTIAEVIQEEALTILAPIRSSSRTPEEIQEEINETNESIQEQKMLKATTTTTPPPPLPSITTTTTTTTITTTTATTAPTLIDSTTSGEEDNGLTSSSDKDNKINQENTTENVHNILDLEKEQNSF